MAEELVVQTQKPAEPTKTEPKAEPKPEPKPEEKDPLEQQRDKLLDTGKALESEKLPPAGEKKDEEEIVDEEEYKKRAWEKLNEDFPQLGKLGYKDSKDAFDKLLGGLDQFQRDREVLKKIEELGYDSRIKKEELLKKLETKTDIQPPLGEEKPKTFTELRAEKLSTLIPKQISTKVEDPNTGETVEKMVDIPKEQKAEHLKSLEQMAESIAPAEKLQAIDELGGGVTLVRDKLAWMLFQLQPILKEFEGKLVGDDTYDEMIKHSQESPHTYNDIIAQEEKKGNFFNYYPALYDHFLHTTKKDQIEAERKKKWEAEKEKEEKAREEAKVETAQRGTEVGKEKLVSQMDLGEKRARLIDLGKKLNA